MEGNNQLASPGSGTFKYLNLGWHPYATGNTGVDIDFVAVFDKGLTKDEMKSIRDDKSVIESLGPQAYYEFNENLTDVTGTTTFTGDLASDSQYIQLDPNQKPSVAGATFESIR